ncbi:MAG TPA: hypothetical protein VMH35_12105 [Streptosporangiaceae bacterium]|nr:hypothetical protein [Streptosporangiaceae bacterium]
MWLVGALVVLLAVGFWAARSRRPRRLARPAGSAAEAAFRRHPAGRARYATVDEHPSPGRPVAPADWAAPQGPDDDADFLAELDRVIRGDGGPDPADGA